MKNKKYAVAAAVVGLALALASQADAKPLKVFILAGQSNMQGPAHTSTFAYIGDDPATAPMLKEMVGADGKPVVCDHAWVSYLTGDDNVELTGKLTAGYGSLWDLDPKKPGDKIGPEFTFGIYMSKTVKEPFLIIKTAWGGKSLHTDFRPPSAGPYVWSDSELSHYKNQSEALEKAKAEKLKANGAYYRLMIEHVRKVVGDIKRVVPSYDPKQGYEIAGFVWLQGFNDLVSDRTYDKRDQPGGFDLYSTLLAQFIRDVRKDLNAPKMPFVIGVLGVGGESDNVIFRKAMAAPTLLPEFKGNVIAVQTALFWDSAIEAVLPKQDKVNRMLETAHEIDESGRMVKRPAGTPGWETLGRPAQEERTWRFISFDPAREQDKMPAGDAKRFRDVALPVGMDQWMMPGFDDSAWHTGKAPVGKAAWKYGRATVQNNSDWGGGEFILMRTSFNVERLDYAAYRLSVLARQGFRIYLNGHEIHTYIWWKDEPYYRSILLSDTETQYLKKGKNVLAAYANAHCDSSHPEPYATIDLAIECITKEGQACVQQELDQIMSPKERRIAAGASNAGYHYFGCAKTFALMGKAFAEALLTL